MNFYGLAAQLSGEVPVYDVEFLNQVRIGNAKRKRSPLPLVFPLHVAIADGKLVDGDRKAQGPGPLLRAGLHFNDGIEARRFQGLPDLWLVRR